MSTPRTDALAKREFVPDGVWIKHARELERENAALREDKQILDWMNGNIEAIMFKYKPDNFIWDVREIMRGAMNKETKP
jgi:uncharacterized Fe-S radical SAM superfamily protein PflX